MGEVWKDIKGYEGIYQVSNTGKVKRVGKYSNQHGSTWTSDRLLSPSPKDNNYMVVGLSREGKVKSKYVHRLVAEAFIPNPENKPTVNHKNGDRSNNHFSNLEWATYLENNLHSIEVLDRDTRNKGDSKPVLQFDKQGNFIKEYPSMREAQRQTGIHAIDKVCAGAKYRHTAGGYIWRYKEDIAIESVETIESNQEPK